MEDRPRHRALVRPRGKPGSRPEPHHAAKEPTTRVPAAGPPVLVADPDPDVRSSTALLVRRLGHPAIEVSQPGDVLPAIERHQPAVVLLETQFPGLNVAGLVASLRTHPATADIPLAFFSASRELPQQAARHRAWATLGKPFAPRELSALLARAYNHPAATAKDPRPDVRAAFREVRNLLAAVENYLALLDGTPDLPADARSATHRLDDVTATLEAKLDHLRAYVLALVAP